MITLSLLTLLTFVDIDKKHLNRYQSFVLTVEYLIQRPLNYTTEGTSHNHIKGALDIGTYSNRLSRTEYINIGKLALDFGYRLGDEVNHLHIDDNYTTKKGITKPLIFLKRRGKIFSKHTAKTKAELNDIKNNVFIKYLKGVK